MNKALVLLISLLAITGVFAASFQANIGDDTGTGTENNNEQEQNTDSTNVVRVSSQSADAETITDADRNLTTREQRDAQDDVNVLTVVLDENAASAMAEDLNRSLEDSQNGEILLVFEENETTQRPRTITAGEDNLTNENMTNTTATTTNTTRNTSRDTNRTLSQDEDFITLVLRDPQEATSGELRNANATTGTGTEAVVLDSASATLVMSVIENRMDDNVSDNITIIILDAESANEIRSVAGSTLAPGERDDNETGANTTINATTRNTSVNDTANASNRTTTNRITGNVVVGERDNESDDNLTNATTRTARNLQNTIADDNGTSVNTSENRVTRDRVTSVPGDADNASNMTNNRTNTTAGRAVDTANGTEDGIEVVQTGSGAGAGANTATTNNGQQIWVVNDSVLSDGQTEANSSVDLTMQTTAFGTMVLANLSDERSVQILLSPTAATEIAGATPSQDSSVELKSSGTGNDERAVYEVKTKQPGMFLGLFRTNATVTTEIDAQTGQIVDTKKPFLTTISSSGTGSGNDTNNPPRTTTGTSGNNTSRTGTQDTTNNSGNNAVGDGWDWTRSSTE